MSNWIMSLIFTFLILWTQIGNLKNQKSESKEIEMIQKPYID